MRKSGFKETGAAEPEVKPDQPNSKLEIRNSKQSEVIENWKLPDKLVLGFVIGF
jgi:hypothetical protein